MIVSAAAGGTMTADVVGWPVVAASLVLVGLAFVVGLWLQLGIGRELLVASARAAVQLLGVGVVFAAAFASQGAIVLAWLWVAAMVVVAGVVVGRRAGSSLRRVSMIGGLTVLVATLVSLAVTFGSGAVTYGPVSLVVTAGITIGNALPTTVLAVKVSVDACRRQRGEIEALLALGLDRGGVVRYLAPPAARAAMIPQVEKTKVVGLIALPGAMTGLLLAGVDPVEAVLVQLLVMYLVLGSVALCVVIVVPAVMRSAVDPELGAAPWVTPAEPLG
ncbi:MAG: ABC transporter permease [Actinomycetota bacterium]